MTPMESKGCFHSGQWPNSREYACRTVPYQYAGKEVLKATVIACSVSALHTISLCIYLHKERVNAKEHLERI